MSIRDPLKPSEVRTTPMTPVTVAKKNREFDPNTFLATIGDGRKMVTVLKKQTIFA